ncbi:interleukin-21 isoform X1 [Simochromis diagramma]|uniref:interleukin-21 isoform X1 n=2 Tax=Simochromis diagramma TaxID=43689 RepID=UPI001A7E3989|nr:interleukin-21 isoform X1 [Simochromis diagramma]
MKLIVFCLFTIYCCSLVKASDMERKKLQEVLRELKMLKRDFPNTELMMNIPPKDIEDCCCLTALTCFRETLLQHFGINGKYQKKLYKSLNHTLTISGLNFCNTETSTTNCSTCHSHPKEKASEFFNRLESLVQRVRLFQIYFRKLYIKY